MFHQRLFFNGLVPRAPHCATQYGEQAPESSIGIHKEQHVEAVPNRACLEKRPTAYKTAVRNGISPTSPVTCKTKLTFSSAVFHAPHGTGVIGLITRTVASIIHFYIYSVMESGKLVAERLR